MHRYVVTAFFWLVATVGGAAEPYDLLIRRAKIVDGTGNAWYHGDVAIRGDKIVAVGRLPKEDAKRTIDAANRVVAPGFIDMHSHSDFLLLRDGSAHSKIRQGVTTEVLGEGNSAGPYQGKLPPRVITIGGKATRWSTLGGYFKVLEQNGSATNVCSYVGLNNLWRSAMGNSFERPTEQEFRTMERLLAAALDDGAMGLSAQVMTPPGSLARTEDVIRLCKVVAERGGIYSTHIRNEGTGVFASVREAIEIGRQAKVPVDIIHLKIADQRLWGKMNEVVELIEAARTEGLNVQANIYPYTRGNNNLSSIIPPWAHEGGRDQLLKRLRDPEARKRMKKDITKGIKGWYNHYTAVGNDWSRMLVSGENRFKGLTMDRVMALRTKGRKADYLDELFDFLVEEGGSVSTVYAHHTETDMNLAMRQPWCSIGSDGSAYAVTGPLRIGNPHPRNFGTFPRVLGRYVRERQVLRLEDAVRKMTSLNANKIGLKRRGLLVPGYYADLVIFDPGEVSDQATYTEPFQYPVGITHVIVNGRLTIEGNRQHSTRAGRVLRRTDK